MVDVEMVYEFMPGPGRSSDGIARSAWSQAKEFFGDEDFALRVDVTGRKGDYAVVAIASKTVKMQP
jgi:hypothetical protein